MSSKSGPWLLYYFILGNHNEAQLNSFHENKIFERNFKQNKGVKIGITFIFRFHRHPIQLVVFVPVGLSSFIRRLLWVFLGVEVSSVARPGQLTVRFQITESFNCWVSKKGQQERTQLIEWDDGET